MQANSGPNTNGCQFFFTLVSVHQWWSARLPEALLQLLCAAGQDRLAGRQARGVWACAGRWTAYTEEDRECRNWAQQQAQDAGCGHGVW